jgi:hypothetical protein
LTRGRIFAEAERMQELVNHEDLGCHTIAVSESPATHVNDLRAGVCERHDRTGPTLWGHPVIEEPKDPQRLGWRSSARVQRYPQRLARFIGEVGQHFLAPGVRQASRSAFDCAPDGQSNLRFFESDERRWLRARGACKRHQHHGAADDRIRDSVHGDPASCCG